MLEIENLNVTIDNKQIINNLNLKINDGEIHVLMGPNGVGKSTLCKVLLNSDEFKINGIINYNGLDILKSNTEEIAKKGIFLLNQNPLAIEGITNAELLRTALRERDNTNINIYEFNKKMENICEKLNIPISFIHREVNVGMSGGEKKKNELLHMWMLNPTLIILDELDSGLDVDSLNIVCSSLNEYYEKYKPSILIITHHENIINKMKPNFVHIINKGTIIKSGDISLAKKIEEKGYNWTNSLSESDDNE